MDWRRRAATKERFGKGMRIEGLLFGLLLIKLALSLMWLGVGGPGQAQAAAAEKSISVPARAAGSEQSLLQRQREELQRREERLQRREAEVEALAAEVEARLDQLNALQARLKADLAEKERGKNKQIKQLVQVYSSMKAEKAAGLISKLDEGVAVDIFSQMPSASAGKILSFVEPEKAARISQGLAGMR